jgi:hypothetical protein
MASFSLVLITAIGLAGCGLMIVAIAAIAWAISDNQRRDSRR